jgi:hypothetical protein
MDLSFSIWILSAALVWLGVLNWRLASKNNDLEEQTDIQHNLILSMAKELKEFGSPNVSVAEPEPTFNITYGKE